MNKTKNLLFGKLASALPAAVLSCILVAPQTNAGLADFEAIQSANANLVFQYRFEGVDDSTRLADGSANGYTLQRVAGSGGGSVNDIQFTGGFDGSSQAYRPAFSTADRTVGAGLITTSTNVPLGAAITLEAVMQLDSFVAPPSAPTDYIFAGRPAGKQRAYALRQNTGDLVTSTFGDNNADQPTVVAYSPGSWYYIALTASYDSGTGITTVNWYGANLSASETTIQFYGSDSTSFTGDWTGNSQIGVGCFLSGLQEYMQGRLDNMALTGEVLTGTDFQNRLNALYVGIPNCQTAAIAGAPANQTVTEGNTASFSISASGTTPAYQWQVSTNNGSNWDNVATGVGGTSATYFTDPTTTDDTGKQYRCIVSVTCDSSSVTSAVASLTVTGAATWTGAADSNWNNTNNWSTLKVPTSTVTATVGVLAVADYSSPMTASSILGLTLAGSLTINTTPFVINANGAAPLTIQPGGLLTINTNGAVTITNSGSVTMSTPTSGTPPAIDVESGSLLLTGNSGSFFMGENTSSDANIGAAFTNKGGNVVVDGQFRVRGRDSRFLMTGGTLDLQGGLSHDVGGNDSRQFFRITGGTANLNAVTINRASTTGGLSVEGGVVNSSSTRIGIGIASGYAQMTGGVWTNAGAFYVADRNNAADSGTRRVYFRMDNGELVTLGGTGIEINHQGEGTSANLSNVGGTLDINGGTITAEAIHLNGPTVTANAYARFELSGGTVYLGTGGLVANTSGAGMTAVLTLTGGTLAAKDDWSSSANLPLGGALTFKAADAAGAAHNITLNGVLSGGTGELIKTGAGTLTLNGANTYGGPTTISAGTLALGSSAAMASSSFAVAGGATLDFTAVGGFSFASGKTLSGAGTVAGSITNQGGSVLIPGDSVGTMTFSGNLTQLGGANNIFELASVSNDLVEVSGTLTLEGINDINVVIVGGSLAPGTYDLFHYTGGLSGGVANLNLIGVPGYLTNRVSEQVISLVTTGLRAPTSVVWVGNAAANDWDILNQTNWLNGVALDSFVNLDAVRFDATGAANSNVNVADNVLVSSMTVDATANYTLAGSGSIGGSGGLLKTNSGTLSLLTTNGYTGPTMVQGGTLQINTVANSGFNSSIGAAGSGPENLVLANGGTLQYAGVSAGTDRGATLGDAGGVFEVTDGGTTLTVAGTVTGSGLAKTGAGALALTAANTYTNGTVLNGGVLSLGNAASAGSGIISNLNGTVLRLAGTYTMANNLDFQGTCALDLNNNSPSGDRHLVGAWSGNATIYITNMHDAGRTFTIGGVGGMTSLSGVIDLVDSSMRLRFNNGSGNPSTGSPNVHFKLGSGSVIMEPRNGAVTIDLGALEGGSNVILRGRASGDSGLVTYSVGALNLDTVFGGSVSNSQTSGNNTAFTKVGTGKLTLTGTSVHTDATTVNDGELQVDGAILNSFVSVNNGTLSGSGTLGQPVTVYGTLSPGSPVGTLTIDNDLFLYGSTLMEVNQGAGTNDLVTGVNNLYYGGNLTVTNLSGTLTNGTVFKLFSAQTYYNDFASITLPELAPGLSWQTNLTVDGTIRIPPLTTPPGLTSMVSGNTLTLTWPETHTGWKLQSQTNDLATGLTGVWTDVPNTEQHNSYITTIDPANATVFYRLNYVVP
jgi:autotransporter-associated beta strand protein